MLRYVASEDGAEKIAHEELDKIISHSLARATSVLVEASEKFGIKEEVR